MFPGGMHKYEKLPCTSHGVQSFGVSRTHSKEAGEGLV